MVKKYRILLIIAILIVLVFSITSLRKWTFVYIKAINEVLFASELIIYDNVPQNSNLDCSTLKVGNFETDKYLIEREADVQIHTNKESNKKTIYKIIWLSNCEYHLHPTDNNLLNIKVKIKEISDQYYDCYVAVNEIAVEERILIR